MKAVTKVIEGGRVTIPAYVREALDIKVGDLVEIDIKKVGE